MEAPVLELSGVVKRYGPDASVGPVDLVVRRGETIALIGPSGAGKSTLLKLMLGLLAPDVGEVRLTGQRLAGEDPAARRRFGYVVQGGGLFPHLTGAGNVALVAHQLGWSKARIAARMAELSALARLPADALRRYPRELSGGQAQRVGLMRALFLDPELLLLDEPLGALDPVTRAELQDDLRAAFRDLHKTVALVTHDLAEAAFFARTLVLLESGRVAQVGSLDELWRTPAVPSVARFVRAHRGLALPAEDAR